jgi:ABC-type uncharacterized transport system permease subunit
MTDRKKKGLGFIISGLVFVLAGIILYATASTPAWLNVFIQGIGWLGTTLGFILSLPVDTT